MRISDMVNVSGDQLKRRLFRSVDQEAGYRRYETIDPTVTDEMAAAAYRILERRRSREAQALRGKA
jgi:hypothetical protein